MGEFVGDFSFLLGVQFTLFAKLVDSILIIDHTKNISYWHLWLETTSIQLVPWSIRERWNEYLFFCKEIDFKVSHIFIKDNHCADKLVSLGLNNIFYFSLYDSLPSIIILIFFYNK